MDLERIKNITPYTQVNHVLYALSKGILELLGDKVIGIYLFGSLSYDDFIPDRSDIDLLVITKEFLSEEELKKIKEFHSMIEEDFKEWKDRIECSYTPLE